ncbi:uncharacterized protein LOC144433497 [Glandiceps talaboti]
MEGGHFHCPHCLRHLRRRIDTVKHIEKCSRNAPVEEQTVSVNTGDENTTRNDAHSNAPVVEQTVSVNTGDENTTGNDAHSDPIFDRVLQKRRCPVCDSLILI